jgi:type II secretory pathway predicted ATPase ExeA
MEGQPGLDRAPRQRMDSPSFQHFVSSRRRALQRLQADVENGQAGPVLITGEPGVGKTWLLRRLVESLPSGWRSVNVDLSSAMDALEFLRLIGHSLGVAIPNRLGEARLLLQSTLQDEATDGRSWLLVVDEAHRGSVQVWDEVHAIRNQLGLKTGFAALFVVGQTELARALATRRFTGFATSLQAKHHLMPLDLDEARELLSFTLRDGIGDEDILEALHRDARGNPGKLLRLIDTRPTISSPDPIEALNQDLTERTPAAPRLLSTRVRTPKVLAAEVEATDDPSASRGGSSRVNPPPLIPARPPIRLEEGLVEVGWEGDLDSEPTREEVAANSPESPCHCPDDSSFNEELIEDRYAALQAWTEWTRNQGRAAVSGSAADPASEIEPGPLEEATELEIAANAKPSSTPQPSAADDASVITTLANVRAEAQHDFAPYSQLFTRLRQSR